MNKENRLISCRIKKAYRRKALELHPDRNYGNVEETTTLFADVQSAYEVLADPQERAWYDSHRDAILRDEDDVSGEHYEHDVRITTADDIIKMFSHFRGQLDFSYSPNGFYSRLREVFETLAREEELACEWENLDPVLYPSFGHASDEYEDVVKPFYAAWNGFATKKTFAWEDVYRFADAPDRRVRRMMEKENKRLRDEGIRKFNDAVRSLIAFVKKRDPRFKPNFETEADRQKIMRDKAAAQAARSRAANQAKQAQYDVVPEWMKSSEVPDAEISDYDEEKVQEQFECVVCKKGFKSEKQYETHEKSKKHVRVVQHVQRQMQKDDENLNLDEPHGEHPKCQERTDRATEADEGDNLPVNSEADVNETSAGETDAFDPESPVPVHAENAGKSNEYHPENENGDENFGSRSNSSVSPSDDEYTTREKVEDRIIGSQRKFDGMSSNADETLPALESITSKLASQSFQENNDSNPQPKIGKAKEKRAKKAAQTQTQSSRSHAEVRCTACQASFPSKTRLFSHIKDFGHAQPMSIPAQAGKRRNK